MNGLRARLAEICQRVGQPALAQVIQQMPEADLPLAVPYVQYAVGQDAENLAVAFKRLGLNTTAASIKFEAALAMSYLGDKHERKD